MAALRPEADDARLRHPAGLRGVLRITAALAMLGTLSLGVAGLAAGCLVVVLTGWSEAGLGATTWAGGAGLLLGAGLIGVGLVLRDDAIDLPEVRVDLDPAVEAAVWTEVHAAAAAVGARLPDRIFLVPGVTVFVRGPTRLPPRRSTALGLGMGLLTVTRVGELRAVLAHELGHVGTVEGELHGVLVRGRISLLRLALETTGRVRRPVRAWAGWYARLVAGIWRGQELATDARAVELCGRDATAAGIEATALAGPVFDHLIERFTRPLWSAGRHPADLYGGLHTLLLTPGRAGEVRTLKAALLREPTSPYGTHPALGDRLAAITALPGARVPFDERPATLLLTDPATAERLLSERMGEAAAGQPTTPVSWADAAAAVYGPAREREAAALTGPDGLRAVLDRLPRPAGPGERELLRRRLGHAVAAELARRPGDRWVLSWVATAVPGGGDAGVDGVLLDAVTDGVPGAAAELRRRLDAAAG